MSNRIEPLVLTWAQERGLLESGTIEGQIEKLEEEFNELKSALEAKDIPEACDAIGDMAVVMTILSYLLGYNLRYCYRQAYNEIKNRKGKMINGIFVKEE